MASIAFIGDISLNGEYIELYNKGIRPFDGLAEELKECDLVIGNLECTAAGEEGENLAKKPRLKTDTRTLEYLGHINVGLACLAHNHVYDNLEDGFRKTIGALDKNNIKHIGASLTGSEREPCVYLEINGLRFAFFNYVSGDTNPGLPEDSGIELNLLDGEKVIEGLARAGDADYRILILHWGGKYENSLYPGPMQIRNARKFINAGADLVIGHHSHTFQPFYTYKNKRVFFSLGNFCFADIHSEGRIKEIKGRWKQSAVVRVDFTGTEYTTRMIPFRLEQHHTMPDVSLGKKFRRRQLYFSLILMSRLFWYIYYFGFKFLRPVIIELKRKDPEKSLLKRLAGLNLKKIRGMFK